jgi:hypothetical protein
MIRTMIVRGTGLDDDVVGKLKATDILALGDIIEKKMPADLKNSPSPT